MPPRFIVVQRTGGPAGTSQWPGAWTTTVDGEPALGVWNAWRLIGSNNRELGRSYPVFDSRPQCLAAAESLQGRMAEATPTVAIDPKSGSWGWRLQLDGTLVAASGRSYHRQRECIYNLQKFTAALPEAVIPPPVAVLDAS